MSERVGRTLLTLVVSLYSDGVKINNTKILKISLQLVHDGNIYFTLK